MNDLIFFLGNMKGWTYKTLTKEDLKMPIVTGEGKRSRLLGTIGVTRGFGDHDLKALGSGVQIKPFLSCHPEVIYRDLSLIISLPDDNNIDGEYGLLVMGTDGLWDVLDCDTVSKIVFDTLAKFPTEKHRYTMVAQELVAKSRGRANESGHWRLSDLRQPATVDDISVIVIPVYQYYKEFCEWEKRYFEAIQKRDELRNKAVTPTMNNLDLSGNSDDDDDDDEEESDQAEEATEEEKTSEPAAIEENGVEKLTLKDANEEKSTESNA